MNPPFAYSQDFADAVAKYVSGNPHDRSPEVEAALSVKYGHTHAFFDVAERYFSLAGKRFLDLGCGTGVVAAVAAERGAEVHASDVVDACLSLTERRLAEHGLSGRVGRYDLREPPPREARGAYDVVWCFQVLEHIPAEDQFRALANLFDLVAPGGHLFIDSENSLCPYDRHDTQAWLIRLLKPEAQLTLAAALGRGLDVYEPSAERRVQLHDYLSYDEITGAARVRGFRILDPFMPHGDARQYLRTVTGSDWLHETLLKHVQVERFAPISLLLCNDAS